MQAFHFTFSVPRSTSEGTPEGERQLPKPPSSCPELSSMHKPPPQSFMSWRYPAIVVGGPIAMALMSLALATALRRWDCPDDDTMEARAATRHPLQHG